MVDSSPCANEMRAELASISTSCVLSRANLIKVFIAPASAKAFLDFMQPAAKFFKIKIAFLDTVVPGTSLVGAAANIRRRG